MTAITGHNEARLLISKVVSIGVIYLHKRYGTLNYVEMSNDFGFRCFKYYCIIALAVIVVGNSKATFALDNIA